MEVVVGEVLGKVSQLIQSYDFLVEGTDKAKPQWQTKIEKMFQDSNFVVSGPITKNLSAVALKPKDAPLKEGERHATADDFLKIMRIWAEKTGLIKKGKRSTTAETQTQTETAVKELFYISEEHRALAKQFEVPLPEDTGYEEENILRLAEFYRSLGLAMKELMEKKQKGRGAAAAPPPPPPLPTFGKRKPGVSSPEPSKTPSPETPKNMFDSIKEGVKLGRAKDRILAPLPDEEITLKDILKSALAKRKRISEETPESDQPTEAKTEPDEWDDEPPPPSKKRNFGDEVEVKVQKAGKQPPTEAKTVGGKPARQPVGMRKDIKISEAAEEAPWMKEVREKRKRPFPDKPPESGQHTEAKIGSDERTPPSKKRNLEA